MRVVWTTAGSMSSTTSGNVKHRLSDTVKHITMQGALSLPVACCRSCFLSEVHWTTPQCHFLCGMMLWLA